MKTSVIGYPRIGAARELKFAAENYFRREMDQQALHRVAAELRIRHWQLQRQHGIDYVPSNDFSFYDGMLDTAVLFNLIPERYRTLGLDGLDTCFAMARGWQGETGDVKALPMKKWFNTNYHYLVPEFEDATEVRLAGTKVFDEFLEARKHQIETKPVLIGPFTLLKLARYTGKKTAESFLPDVANAYADVLAKLDELGAAWVQFDEPSLVTDLTPEDLEGFRALYEHILPAKKRIKAVLQTYFGDVRDAYETIVALPFDGIGLDFVEGRQSLFLLERHGFADDKVLFAGVVNGKNIWKNDYARTLATLQAIGKHARQIVIGTSCSLLHVPCSVRHETGLPPAITRHLAFAEEKLQELAELKQLASVADPAETPLFRDNAALFAGNRHNRNEQVQARINRLTEEDFVRKPAPAERAARQKDILNLPALPTTTIGSFPQTPDVRANRAAYKKGAISKAQYDQFVADKISQCVRKQDALGLDVLVHGEYERNDMVEYFGECLEGFLFTKNGWVQSYGTRCVKPPIIWGDVARTKPITVEHWVRASRQTGKPVKGMLTGPVTILNWSFPREDIPNREIALQLALAIRDEVLDLEAHGAAIIQIDEAALREKLPLRRADWHRDYLGWAIPAFRLVHSGVKPETQIHTHMCYSEFSDILDEIDAMDADVITFEASRSNLELLDDLQRNGFQTHVGPGVYDIHSPRIPGVGELKQAIRLMLDKLGPDRLWINPDCGLKTRGEAETWASLENLVTAVKEIRAEQAEQAER